MLHCIMIPILNNAITEDQWNKAADQYELGLQHAVHIASGLGVHPSTVSREFKRRGLQKGSKVALATAELETVLDHHSRQRELACRSAADARIKAFAVTEVLIHDMMLTIIAASKAGDLTLAVPKIEQVGSAMKAR